MGVVKVLKKSKFWALLLLLILVLVGCSNSEDETNSKEDLLIELNLVKEPTYITQYTTKLIHNGTLIKEKNQPISETSLNFREIKTGDYQLKLNAEDNSRNIIMTKSKNIAIQAEESLTVDFSVDPYPKYKLFTNQQEAVIKAPEKVNLIVYGGQLNEGQFEEEYELTVTHQAKQFSLQTSSVTKPKAKLDKNISAQEQSDIRLRRLGQKYLQENNKPALQSKDLQLQTVAQNRKFVLNQDNDSVQATLVKESENAYFYKKDGVSVSDDLIDQFATEFNQNIYDKVLDQFTAKSKSFYDWDNNGKVIILLTPIDSSSYDNQTIVGYFHPKDYWAKEDIFTSNEADMFYINTNAIAKFKNQVLFSTLAHELQHLLFYGDKKEVRRNEEDTWINEGLSTVAEYVTGYTGQNKYVNNSRIPYYFEEPSAYSLRRWDSTLADYGLSNLFTHYFKDNYGTEVLKEISAAESIIPYLEKESGLKFDQLKRNFYTANLTPNNTLEDEFNYDQPVGGLPFINNVAGDIKQTATLKDDVVRYYSFDTSNSDIKIRISNKNLNWAVWCE